MLVGEILEAQEVVSALATAGRLQKAGSIET